MENSGKIQDLIAELNEFSGSKIKNIPDLSYLIELSKLQGKEQLFNDIQFSAKYLNGLTKILQSNAGAAQGKNQPQTTPEEAREKILQEYKKELIKFTGFIKDLLTDAPEVIKAGMEERYLTLNRTSMVNLTSLIYDLSWLKKLNNSKRD